MEENSTTDVATVVEKMRNHRFDGYGATLIAWQIDAIRSGVGAGSINTAVDALQQVATALTETENTLRTELGKLGVSWHGSGGVAAGAAIADEADFSNTTAVRLQHAAHALFGQGDAFNRTRAKLPDSEQVRAATEETNLGDDLMSLVGFETDHASRLAHAREAWHHAVQVLNEYCAESADHLDSTEAGADPEALEFAVAGSTSPGIGAGKPPVAPDADATALVAGAPVSTSTGAAGVAESAPAAGTTNLPPSTYPRTSPHAGVTPGGGVVGQVPGDASTSTSGVAIPTAYATPSAPAASAGHGGIGSVGGQVGQVDDGRPASGRVSGGESTTELPGQPRGRDIGRLGVPAPGTQTPAGGIAGKSFTPLSPIAGGDTGPDGSLARGRMSGLVAQPASSGGYAGGAYAARATAGMSATDLGTGAAALGAGGVAGAMSGDSERHGGGLGRSASSAANPDDDEAEAVAAERIEAGANSDPAAAPDDESAGEH